MNKRVTAIGLTAGLLAGAGAGLILEMSGSAGASAKSVTVAAAATDDTTNTAGSTDNPSANHTARLTAVLAPLVADGTITQAQADKVITALEAAGPMGRDGDHGPGGPGMGGPGMGGPGKGGPGMGGQGGGLATVATTLGLTSDEVRTAIQGGQTIAQLAEANGKTAQSVIDALVAEVKAHFDAEVASGEHTQADADARIAEATTQITDFVNNTQTAAGPGMGGRHGRGPGGHDADNGTGSGAGGTSGGSIDAGPSDTPTTAGA
jgi:hypothetical protein